MMQTKCSSFEPSSLESASPASLKSFESDWQQQTSSRQFPPRWRLAGGVAGAIAVTGIGLVMQLMRLSAPPLGSGALGDQGQMQRDSEAWLTDIMAARRVLDAAPAEKFDSHADRKIIEPESSPSLQKAASIEPVTQYTRPKRTTRRPNSAPNARAQNEAAPDDDFTALFGSGARFAKAAKHASNIKAAGPPATQAQDWRGRVLEARLLDEVASDPAGAPIIALLTQDATLGETLLPRGTELHGTVQGTSAEGARVFINFEFARKKSGSIVELRGDARDQKGRFGVPGRKIVTHKAVGSVGLASATRAMQAAGHQLAGSAGTILGAGLGGLVDTGGDKLRRIDGDEVVVIAAPQTRINIYLQSIGPKK